MHFSATLSTFARRLLPLVVLVISGIAALGYAQSAADGLSLQRLEESDRPLLEDPERNVVSLTLEECIHRGLAHNLDVRIGGYGPAIQMTDVVRAEAAFDAVLFATVQHDNVDRANLDSTFFEREVVTPGGTGRVRVPLSPFDRYHDTNYSVGLRKRLSSGGFIELAQSLRRYRNLVDRDGNLYRNPFHEFALALQLTQPLLRDFGIDINRAAINAARNNYRISQQQFNLLVIDTVAEIEANYWRLVLARQQLSVFRALLAEAETTLEKLRYRAEQDANIEVLSQTRSLMERARAGIVSARNNVIGQQSRLLESMNDPELQLTKEWEIIPAELPTSLPCAIDDQAALVAALELRPEVTAQRIRIETSEIGIDVAQNQTLPRLDFFLRQQASGAGHTEGGAWDQQWQRDQISYGMGVTFETPIGNRAALAELSRSRTENEMETARLDSVREQILADVRIALDAVRYGHNEIIARRSAALAESHTLEGYRAQQEAEAGTNPAFLDRMLRAQERLANALLSLSQATASYNVAIMNAQRAQGTLLDYNNVQLAETAPRRP